MLFPNLKAQNGKPLHAHELRDAWLSHSESAQLQMTLRQASLNCRQSLTDTGIEASCWMKMQENSEEQKASLRIYKLFPLGCC